MSMVFGLGDVMRQLGTGQPEGYVPERTDKFRTFQAVYDPKGYAQAEGLPMPSAAPNPNAPAASTPMPMAGPSGPSPMAAPGVNPLQAALVQRAAQPAQTPVGAGGGVLNLPVYR